MAARPLVDFIIAGVQKGGTTALFDYLGDHPALALSKVKEVHFFDDETQDWSDPDYGAYHAQFDGAAEGALKGEATPIYVYWPNALERIRAYNPAARLIILLRDPVERAFSHWRMEAGRGVETHSFGWCVREGRQRLFRAEPWGVHREFSYVERGYYGEQMERLFGLFPREQVLVLRSDALDADPNGTLAAISRFLGVDAPALVTPRRVHVGTTDRGAAPDAADAAFLRSLYARDMERLADLAGVRF